MRPGRRRLPAAPSLSLPAIVVELKWNREVGGAITQMRDRNYAAIPEGLCGEVLLVGVTYDTKIKTHVCTIEREVLET